jgi:hypothetical protein
MGPGVARTAERDERGATARENRRSPWNWPNAQGTGV